MHFSCSICVGVEVEPRCHQEHAVQTQTEILPGTEIPAAEMDTTHTTTDTGNGTTIDISVISNFAVQECVAIADSIASLTAPTPAAPAPPALSVAKNADSWSSTLCGHVFHTSCVTDRWNTCKTDGVPITCPECWAHCGQNLINLHPSKTLVQHHKDKQTETTEGLETASTLSLIKMKNKWLKWEKDEIQNQLEALKQSQAGLEAEAKIKVELTAKLGQVTDKVLGVLTERDAALEKLAGTQNQLDSALSEITDLKEKLALVQMPQPPLPSPLSANPKNGRKQRLMDIAQPSTNTNPPAIVNGFTKAPLPVAPVEPVLNGTGSGSPIEIKNAVVRLTRLRTRSMSAVAGKNQDQGPVPKILKVGEIMLDESGDESDATVSNEVPVLEPRSTKPRWRLSKASASRSTDSATAMSMTNENGRNGQENEGEDDTPISINESASKSSGETSLDQELALEPKPSSSSTPMPGSVANQNNTSSDSIKRKSVQRKDEKMKKIFWRSIFYVTADGTQESVDSFVRKTSKLIMVRGGGVCEYVGDEKKSKLPAYLISNKETRTVEYMYCLAAGIPCVGVQWISKCIRENSAVDWKPYELPRGWSIERICLIQPRDDTSVSTLLQNLSICICPEVRDNQGKKWSTTIWGLPTVYWMETLQKAGARFLEIITRPAVLEGNATTFDVILADEECPTAVLKIGKMRKIPIVTAEWLLQAIIVAEVPAFDGHQEYKLA